MEEEKEFLIQIEGAQDVQSVKDLVRQLDNPRALSALFNKSQSCWEVINEYIKRNEEALPADQILRLRKYLLGLGMIATYTRCRDQFIDIMPEFIGDVLLDIFEARAQNSKLLLPIASLQVEALRCCTKILQAYEHRMKAFDNDILEFFSATIKRLGQIYVNTGSNTNNSGTNIEFNPEFGALYSKIEGEVKNEIAKTYNELLLRGIEYILSLIQIDSKLVAEFGPKIVPNALILFNAMSSHKERIEMVELIGQICLLGLDKQHRSTLEGFVKRQRGDEDDDEDPYEEDDEAELEEEEDDDDQGDKAALWNPVQSTPFGIIESTIKTAISIYFMDVNGEEEKEELGSIPFLMSILLGLTSAYYTPQQHVSLFNSIMDLFVPKFESYNGQIVSADFLGSIKMILDNASSDAVNPHFIKLFDLIEKSLDDAKEWLKTPPTTKGKRKQYNKIRLSIIRAMGALLKSASPNILLRAEHFYHECLANFADPILLSQFVVGLSDLLKREDVPDPLEAIESNGGSTFVEKGKPLNFIQARGKMRDSYVQYIVNQLVGELQKQGTSKNIKQMILTSMEILISRVEPRWLEAYAQILISNLLQSLKNQLMAVGLKAVKCLHLLFVQLKDNTKIHANLDEVTRDLVVLIKEDWNPNKPEHSDEDDEDEDSIEVDIAPKLALQAMKFFKSVYSIPELCAVANEKLSKIFVRNLFEFLLASMNKEIFFDDDVDLRFAQQELVDLMYKNVPYLFQDACKQKYVRALKAVIIHAQEADIDVLVEKMETCLYALIGSV